MPRDVVALVSADDFVSAIRVYADRIHDLLRRSGVPATEAIEVAETQALALLDAVVNAPETVVDLAGWWFARAIELTSGSDRAGQLEAVTEPISMLAGTAGEEQVRDALSALPDSERAAVVLRDGYDLPPQAVGVALRRGVDSAAELAAAGRLHLVAAYDDRRVPDLSGHSGRTTVDLVSLSRLAEGTLESPRAAPLRRHVGNCSACEDVLESLAKGRRLAAGLPIIAMDDDAREALIERIAERAVVVLPSHDAVLRAVDEDHDPGPTISPVIAVIALVLALALGIAIAVISREDSSPGPAPAPTAVNTIVPPVVPSFSVSASASPTAHRHKRVIPPSLPTPTVSASLPTSIATLPAPADTDTTALPATATSITESPTHGPSGTSITVTGSGWQPGSTVTVTYAMDGSEVTATVDANGDFSVALVADSLLPGQVKIRAIDGNESATIGFDQRL